MGTTRLMNAALGALALAVPLAGAEAGGAAMSIVYDAEEPAREIFTGPGALTPERGGHRQDPGTGGVFRPDGDSHRLGKIDDRSLRGLDAAAMAAAIREVIDETPSHLVGIDEIGNAWRDPAPEVRFKWVSVRGKRYRIAEHNDIELTGTGWRLVRRPPTPPMPGEEHRGRRFSRAMEELARTPHPAGGSYADRVHVYAAPALVTSVALGNGPHFTLDAAHSRRMRAAWRGVVRGLALAGGVWLEMYHGDISPVAAEVWRAAPRRVGAYLGRHGGAGLTRVHLLIAGATRLPDGAPASCGAPMACQFALAASTAEGRTALANGPGAYRVGEQARAWLAELNRPRPPAREAPADGGAEIRLSARQLLINQRIGQAAIRRLNAVQQEIEGSPTARASRSGGGGVRVSARQFRINQRIYQAGVRRAGAIEARLDARVAPESRAAPHGGTVRLTRGQLRINQRIAQAAVRRANALRERLLPRDG